MTDNQNNQNPPPHRVQGQGGDPRLFDPSIRNQAFYSFLSHLQSQILELEEEEKGLKSSLATAQEALQSRQKIISETYQVQLKEQMDAFTLAIADKYIDDLEIGTRHRDRVETSFEELQSKLAGLSSSMEEAMSGLAGLQTETGAASASNVGGNGNASAELTIRLEKLEKQLELLTLRVEEIRDGMFRKLEALRKDLLSAHQNRPSTSGSSTVTGGGNNGDQQGKVNEEGDQDNEDVDADADDKDNEEQKLEGTDTAEVNSASPGDTTAPGGPVISRFSFPPGRGRARRGRPRIMRRDRIVR